MQAVAPVDKNSLPNLYLPLNTSRLTLRCNIPKWIYSPLKVFWYFGQQRNVISAYALNTGLKRIKTYNKTCLLVDIQDISDPTIRYFRFDSIHIAIMAAF